MDDPGRLDWDFIPKPGRQGIPSPGWTPTSAPSLDTE